LKLLEHAKEDFLVEGCTYILDKELKDEIWFVIDTDEWNKGNKINALREFCKKQNEQNEQNEHYSAWTVAQSNPCFELWLYYHDFAKKPSENEVNSYSTFKDFLDKKIPGGFDNRKKPVLLGAAINNSKTNFIEVDGQPGLYSTEVHRLGEVIYPFVKESILKILKRNN